MEEMSVEILRDIVLGIVAIYCIAGIACTEWFGNLLNRTFLK